MDGWNGWVDGWDEMVQGRRFKYGLTCSSAFASSTRPARWLCFRIASRSIWYLPHHHINLVLRIKNFTRPGNEIIGLPQYISWFWFYLVRRWMGLISRSVSRSLNPYFNRISWREKILVQCAWQMIRRMIKRRCNFMKTYLKVVVYVFRHNVLWLWLVLAIHDIPANHFVQNIFLWCLDDDRAALHLKLPLVLLEEIAQVNRVWDTLLKVLWEEAERKKDLSDLKIVPKIISIC